jgi:hypothetical protein
MKGSVGFVLSTAALLLAGATAACGDSPGHVAGADVANQIKTQLTASVGQAPDSVTCPNDLEATVGATTRCTLTTGGLAYGVSVTVTAVHGTSTVDFTIRVDQTPVGGGSATSNST